jgi:predicted nucleotidyltransferase
MAVNHMIYTLDDIKKKIVPIAKKYNIPAVWVFGSYARGEADEDSDVDLLISRKGSKLVSLFDMGALYNDLNDNLGKNLDLVELENISTDEAWAESPWFIKSVYDDRVKVYEEY